MPHHRECLVRMHHVDAFSDQYDTQQTEATKYGGECYLAIYRLPWRIIHLQASCQKLLSQQDCAMQAKVIQLDTFSPLVKYRTPLLLP